MPSRRAPAPDSPFYTIMGWIILLGIIKAILEALFR